MLGEWCGFERVGALAFSHFQFAKSFDIPNHAQYTEHVAVFDNICEDLLRISSVAGDARGNYLLLWVRNHSSSENLFFRPLNDMLAVLQYHKEQGAQRLLSSGFTKEVDGSSYRLEYEIYVRDPVRVLQNQVLRAPSDSSLAQSRNRFCYYPLSPEIYAKVWPAARQAIEKSTDSYILWKNFKTDGVKHWPVPAPV